ncbi:MAG: hypothetical protein BVN28_01785 [Nitrospira sp. ST-bin4]|nr:MAG: hypothetical protein BVN28_01785 [Nitrospira sp. ST-bin4]
METILFGFVMYGAPLLVLVLFDVLSNHRQQKNAEGTKHALGIASQSTGSPECERGKTKQPRNEYGSRAGGLYVDGDISQHIWIPP